jgi:hypothetical protein
VLACLAGPEVSARSIRRDVIAMAPQRLEPEIDSVPVLLLDGTGERAGKKKSGVALHLAIGLVSRRRNVKRVSVEARILGATVAEGWSVMGDLLVGLAPGLILVDGEEELSALAAERFPGAACGALPGASIGPPDTATGPVRTWPTTSAASSRPCSPPPTVIRISTPPGPPTPPHRRRRSLRAASDEVFTFLTHPGAGQLFFGDKGRPERPHDVGVRWSVVWRGRQGDPHGQGSDASTLSGRPDARQERRR